MNSIGSARADRCAHSTLSHASTPDRMFFIINGSSSSGSAVGTFDCYAPQSALQFTVPPFVLSALPAGKEGIAAVQNLAPYAPFSAQGLDTGDGLAFTSVSVSSKIQ